MADLILLTGASGLVGRSLLAHPELDRDRVLAPAHSELDLLDRDAVRGYLRRHRPTAIVHAAGRVGGIAANLANQPAFLADNLRMGLNLIEAAAAEGVPRFLNLSSSCVYPRLAPNPLKEDSLFTGPVEPTNEGYALAKLTVLRHGEFVAERSDSFRWVSLIPCNLFGPWDHFEPERSHLIAAAIRKLHVAMARGEDTVTIWGTGEVRREFMLASDLATYILAALRDFDRLPRRVNVGVGHDYTVNEYYRMAAEVVGFRGTFTHDLTAPTGMPRKLLDVTAQRGLGWPEPTDLRQGLATTYEFFRTHVTD